MGDLRFQDAYRRVKEAESTAAILRELADEEVIAALAAASRHQDPYLANVLATEALNRVVQKNAIVTNAGEGVYAVNRSGCITFLNPAAERMLGVSLGEVALHHVHEILSVQDAKGSSTSAREDPALAAMRRGSAVRFEGSLIHRRDGKVFPAAATAAPILRDGDIDGAVVVLSDITERQRAEDARRESEGRLRAVMTSAPVVLFVLDMQGIFMMCEGKGLEPLGLRPEDVLGRSIFDLQAQNAVFLDHARRALAGESFVGLDELDGRMFEKNWAPLRGSEGSLLGTICVSTDVTERVRAEQAKRSLEERYRLLFDHHPDAIGSTDLGGRIVTVNPAFERLLGWSREELPGRYFGELVDPSDRERVERVLSTFGTSNEGIEFAMLARDGRRVDVRGVAVPMLVNGVVVGFHGVVQDISARKRAERELRESRESMWRIVNSLAEAVLILDARGGIHFANDAAVQLFGRPREDLVGVRLDDPRWEATTPEGLPLAPRDIPFARAIEKGDVVTGFVCALRRSNGTRPVVRASIVPTRGPAGEVNGAVVSFTDITQGMRAELRLRQREEAYRALAEHLPDLVVRFDHCLRHVFVNHAFVAATGLAKEAVLGKTCSELGVLGVYAGAVENQIRNVLRRGKAGAVEHTLACRDGSRLMETRLVPEFSEAGTVRYVLGVSRDVTERKRHEESLARSNEDLARRVELNTRQLVETMADLTVFAAVSRERLLKPLEAADELLRSVESGERGLLGVAAHDALTRARAENGAASQALERLLELRRVAVAELGEPRSVDLREELSTPTWADRCGRVLAERNARLEAKLDDAPRLFAPSEALAGLLGDLVVDMLAWADARSPVVAMDCKPSPVRPGWAEVDIVANGAGIPSGAIALLQGADDVETWARDAMTCELPAFRLGLARRLARRLGGTMRLREHPGGGAAVQLVLPIAPP